MGSIIILLTAIVLLLMVILPSLPRYDIASISEARSWGHIDDEQIVDELGDTNGPYKLTTVMHGGVGKPFDIALTVNGHITNWTQPVSNHMWFVATVFQNRRGNQFAVIRKRTE